MIALRFPGHSTLHLLLSTIIAIFAFSPLVAAQGLPLTMSKSFSPAAVVVGGTSTTTMTVTVTNPNAVGVSGVGFSDTYPAGLVPDVVGAYTCAAGTAVFTGAGWVLTNVTLGAGASCSVPMLMHATITGPITNTTSLVTAFDLPPGGPASATLNVSAAGIPTLSGWMLLILVIMIGTLSIISLRRRADQVA